MLRLEGINAGYSAVPVLHGVSIAVDAGQFVSIVGPNGAGKTTLFKTISGTLRPTAGSIRFEDVDLLRVAPARRPHLGIAHVPEGRQVFPSLTVLENLEMGAYTRGRPARLEAQHQAHLRLAAGARRTARAARRHAFGRRAADARDRPRPRLLAQAPDAGRAVDGARADHRRLHLRAADGDPQGRGAHHPAGRAARGRGAGVRRPRLRAGDRTRGAGRARRRRCAPTIASARPTSACEPHTKPASGRAKRREQ